MILADIVGLEVTIPEVNNATAIYNVAGIDAHGSGLATLVRKYISVNERIAAIDNDTVTYGGSAVDIFCSNLLSAFPTKLQRLIVPVTIRASGDTNGVYETITRSCFIPSCSEVGFPSGQTVAEGPALSMFSTNSSRQKQLTNGNSLVSWWLRSKTIRALARYYFQCVSSTGINSSNSSTSSYGVVPCFCISADRPIYDTPNPDGTYNLSYAEYIDVDIPLGTTISQPKAIRTALQYKGLITSLYVCNNYDDSDPVWEPALDLTQHIFTNTTKTASQWSIAVRVKVEREEYEEIWLNEFPVMISF